MPFDPSAFSLVYVRPDGRDAKYYLRLAAEGRVRLAWECLIRIDDFQLDCYAALAGLSDPAEIATDWGLYSFKPWNEPFGVNERPRFADWVRKFSGSAAKPVRRVGMKEHEVAYVFNLQLMSRSPENKKAQLAMLLARLERELDRYARETGTTVNSDKPARAAPHVHVEACLQVADLEHSRLSSDDIKRLVPYLELVRPANVRSLPGQKGVNDTSKVNGRFRDVQRRARELIEERGYMKLFLPISSSKG